MNLIKTIALFALLLGICTMGYAREQMTEAKRIYQEGEAVYADLCNSVKENASAGALLPNAGSAGNTAVAGGRTEENGKIYIPEIGINFDNLSAVSGDAVAWLYCPDTVIDYPVMKAEEYSYYLNHLPDGTQNANGSLFIDFNNAPDFSEALTVIYGHNMRSKMMFGSLAGYKSQGYYDEHPYMYLYTKEANYRIELLYGCVVGAGQWRERAFMYGENAGALIEYAAQNTTFESGAVYSEGDRIIAMSTCSYEFENARYVVIGKVSE